MVVEEGGPSVSAETQKHLEKALASYSESSTHLEGISKEYKIAKAHHDIATRELRSALLARLKTRQKATSPESPAGSINLDFYLPPESWTVYYRQR